MAEQVLKNHEYNTRSKSKPKSNKDKKKDKKEIIKKDKQDLKLKKKFEDDSSSDESYISESDTSETEEDMEEFNPTEYKKLLADLFPSKYSKDKAKSKSKSKSKSKNSKKNKNIVLSKKKKKKVVESESEEESDLESDSESEYEDEEETIDTIMKNGKFVINFTLPGNDDDYSDEEYEDESEYDTEEDESEEESEQEDDDETKNDSGDESDFMEEKDNIELLKEMMETYMEKHNNKNDLPKSFKTIKKEIEKKEALLIKNEKKIIKKQKKKNVGKFVDLLKENKKNSDVKYFKNELSVRDQKNMLEKLQEVINFGSNDKPHKLKLLESDIPIQFKSIAYKKLISLKGAESGSELHKLKLWCDTFMSIPFNQFKELPVSSANNDEETCAKFIADAKHQLDEAVFGMEEVKLQIMQMVGNWVSNPKAIGTAIAIKGPMGTGKTTLVKDGISKVLGRDFAFITLGGATDSAFLEGHSFTYEGSMWGQIVDSVIKCGSMNPVFFFDELDKISDTPKGEEITGILTHLTDTTQNHKFHDKYFSEIEFDLSKCLFIFSYNDESKVNPILLDRMYKVETKAYALPEKTEIVKKHLLPNLLKQVAFAQEDVILNDKMIKFIIENYTNGEAGVRNLKRCLEIIYQKLNLYKLMDKKDKLFDKLMELDVTFPFTIDDENITKLLIKNNSDASWKNMYM